MESARCAPPPFCPKDHFMGLFTRIATEPHDTFVVSLAVLLQIWSNRSNRRARGDEWRAHRRSAATVVRARLARGYPVVGRRNGASCVLAEALRRTCAVCRYCMGGNESLAFERGHSRSEWHIRARKPGIWPPLRGLPPTAQSERPLLLNGPSRVRATGATHASEAGDCSRRSMRSSACPPLDMEFWRS